MAKKKPRKLENIPKERFKSDDVPYLTGVAMEKAGQDGDIKEVSRLVEHVIESKKKKP